jgi:hypothetical protein
MVSLSVEHLRPGFGSSPMRGLKDGCLVRRGPRDPSTPSPTTPKPPSPPPRGGPRVLAGHGRGWARAAANPTIPSPLASVPPRRLTDSDINPAVLPPFRESQDCISGSRLRKEYSKTPTTQHQGAPDSRWVAPVLRARKPPPRKQRAEQATSPGTGGGRGRGGRGVARRGQGQEGRGVTGTSGEGHDPHGRYIYSEARVQYNRY